MQDKMMQAMLDDMNLLYVEVSKKFYDGQCNDFYMQRSDGVTIECKIQEVKETESCLIYKCSFDGEIDFSKSYVVVDNHGKRVILIYRFVVKTKRFEEMFTYHGEDLGPQYSKEETKFALWAPTATAVHLELDFYGKKKLFPTIRDEYGVYRVSVKEDLHQATYLYLVEVNGNISKVIDPYALSTTANTQRSAVIDLSKIRKREKKVQPIKATDAVIYECSVRDLTMSETANTKLHGTYPAFIERESKNQGYKTGFDYIRSLGVTHIQLMPIYDFATIDEENPLRNYNWGYDPQHYFGPEGSYSSDPHNPYTRIQELRDLVDELHQEGLYVNLDMVMNHHYDSEESSLNKIVPYYYFRYTEDGEKSNGTFCGNEFQSDCSMGRKYIIDQLMMWTTVYGVDGFRFDLMGIMDVETMNQAAQSIKALNSSSLLYGEGWDMPTTLSSEQKAMIANQDKMPEIGHFNDRFRDFTKGSSIEERKGEKGYCTGNTEMIKDVAQNLIANVGEVKSKPLFTQPAQVINYVECHDNQTLWDKLSACCPEESEEIRVLRQKMIIACTIFAQGIPFIHCGQEFCRTKDGYDNTYNLPDKVNQVDWNRMVQYRDVVQYFRSCLMVRRNFESFRLKTTQEIQDKVTFGSLKNGALIYDIAHQESKLNCQGMMVVINPFKDRMVVQLKQPGKVILNEKGFSSNPSTVTEMIVEPYSVVVCAKL